MALLSVICSFLSSILTILSSHYDFHELGRPIAKILLSGDRMQRLNTYIGSSHNELIMSTLKLLNALTAFAGGKECKLVFESFAWETKVSH